MAACASKCAGIDSPVGNAGRTTMCMWAYNVDAKLSIFIVGGFRPVSVADGFDEQRAQGLIAKHLAQHIKHLSAQGASFLLQLGKQARVDIALARLRGHQIPEVTDLGLPDAMDAPKALFQP